MEKKVKIPVKKGFNNYEEAWEYIISRMCEDCQKEYQKELKDPKYHGYYPCKAEWFIDEEE